MVESELKGAEWGRRLCQVLRTWLGAAVVISIALAFGTPSRADNAAAGNNFSSADTTQRGTEFDDASKAKIFHEVLSKFAAGEKPDPALLNQFVSIQNAHVRTGPKIGEKVPDFALPDQNGRQHTLSELMGPNGLLLVFVRSADW